MNNKYLLLLLNNRRAIYQNQLLKSIINYTTFNLINAIIPFLLLPILTNYLSPSQYGLIDLFMNFSFILMPIVGLNVNASVVRFYFDLNKEDFGDFLITIISFSLGFGLMVLFISYFINGIAQNYFKLPDNFLFLCIIYALSSQICEILLSFWRAEDEPSKYGVFRIVKTLMDIGISLLLIIKFQYNWEGRIFPMVIVSVLFAIFVIIYFSIKYSRRRLFKLNRKFLLESIKFSAPLILHTMGGYIITFSDRLIVAYQLNLDELGIYAVGSQIGMILSFIITSFNQAWLPYFFKTLNNGNEKAKIKLQQKIWAFIIFISIIAVLIYLILPFIYKFFINKNYNINYIIILWILIGYIFNGMYKMFVNYLFYYKKTNLLMLFTPIAALLNIIFVFILVNKIGIEGAAIGTMISYIVLFLLVFIYYNRNLKYR